MPLIIEGIFYTQESVRMGRCSPFWKFRSMKNDSESNGAVFPPTRVTAFGKFMRKTRIDEFPNFLMYWRAIYGVGPRPERPFCKRNFRSNAVLWDQAYYKTGLTGWAQVNYSYGASIDDSLIKLQYDLYYIKHRSLFDLNIALKTITTVLFYRGQAR
jgi:lipopolysaccharide/colanic/teichoic acid biosynthesis glycosyltransferase